MGVQRVGPAIAGFFSNLTPLFAALPSAAFLGELPQPYHALAFLLIVGGIVVSSRRWESRKPNTGSGLTHHGTRRFVARCRTRPVRTNKRSPHWEVSTAGLRVLGTMRTTTLSQRSRCLSNVLDRNSPARA